MVSTRNTRSTLSARSTAKGPLAGTSAMATTARSNTLHGSRKKAPRKATMRRTISTVNTASSAWSSMTSQRPQACMIETDVSRPSTTALTTISARTRFWVPALVSRACSGVPRGGLCGSWGGTVGSTSNLGVDAGRRWTLECARQQGRIVPAPSSLRLRQAMPPAFGIRRLGNVNK